MGRMSIGAALVALLLASAPAWGASITASLVMTGAQEVPGPGDPDGLATGTITLDDSTGVISWNFVYTDIAAPNLMHIHGPNAPAGTAAGPFIGLGVSTSGGAGTLISSLTHSPTSDVTAILNDPSGFYVNIHNVDFVSGALRGQIPEPSTALLLTFGLALLGIRRARASA